MQPASILIDRIIYTASLATNTDLIDPILDSLRSITTRIDATKPLSESDNSTLLDIQHQLESYLINEEKIRYFTAESLQLQIEEHERGGNHKALIQLYVGVGTSVLVGIIVGCLPFLADLDQRILAGGAAAFSSIHIAAALLFLTALPAFRSQLRRAFLIIWAAVSLLGLSLLAHPVMEIFDLRQYPIASILFTLPILAAATLFHVGNTIYARLLGVKNIWSTPWPLVFSAIVTSLVTWFLPQPVTSEPSIVHDTAAVMWGLICLTPIASAIVLHLAERHLPEVYKPSVKHLYQAMFAIMAVTIYQYVLRVVAGPFMQGWAAYVLFSLVFIMGLALLRAGYTFNRLSKY